MSNPLEVQLKALDSNALTTLLLKRAEFDEDFQLWLEMELAGLGARQTRQPLDPELLRRRIETVFAGSGSRRRSRDDWVNATSDIEVALDELLDQADAFLAAGDGHNALAILVPSGANLAEYYPEVAGWDETLHEFFPRLDRMIAQAVLLDGVSQEMRENLVDDLGYWQDENGVYDDAFSTATGAATLGWDEPGLADVLAGRDHSWPLGESSEWEGDQLITARLAALEAMGSTDQFLNLARAARRHADQAVMLAKRKVSMTH